MRVFSFGIGLTVIAAGGCINDRSSPATDDLYLSTSSENDARVAALLPTKGTEDVSRLLSNIEFPKVIEENEDQREYLPNEATDWILDVQWPGQVPIDALQLAELFDTPFRKRHGSPTFYGCDSASGRWTFLVSADGPKTVKGLKIAWDYYAAWESNPITASAKQFEERISAAKERLKPLVGEVTTRASLPAHEAAARSEYLSTLKEKFDKHISFQLVAPKSKPFRGKDIWDVMLCLGLTWGDMDCFHWDNVSGTGDDYHFSVETSTPPGYFLPEKIAADQLQTNDLIFTFSIPRSADPIAVAEGMQKAVYYAQSRLGGEIRYEIDTQASDLDSVMSQIRAIAQELTKQGFAPGSSSALRFF